MQTRPVVLVSGFSPFGADCRNPSGEIAQALDGKGVAAAVVHGRLLPVTFGIGAALVEAARAQPDVRLVVALGVDSKRVERGCAIETFARNAYRESIDQGPRAIDTQAPVEGWALGHAIDEVLSALHSRGIAAHASRDAGLYVCNDTFARLLRAGLTIPAFFVHIPRVREMGGPRDEQAPSLASLCADVHALIEELYRAFG